MHRWRLAFGLGLILICVSWASWRWQPVAAQNPEDDDQPPAVEQPLCFSSTGFCINGAFRRYWETNGGLSQFGYPITAEIRETTSNGIFTVQYFERARFEYHPEHSRQFEVQLGRLGAELYRIGHERETARAGCRYFDRTGFNVCEPFRTKWETVGTTPGATSLEIYGLPISPLLVGRDPAGNPISFQWFERGRMELHQSNLVVLGLVGVEYRQREQEPRPTPTPTIPVVPTPAPIEPTAIPTAVLPIPINVPFPDRPCHINVPAPIEGIQAWATLPVVSPPEDEVICVRLIVNGEAAHPAFVNIYRYIGNERIPGTGHTTGLDGTASFVFHVRDLPIGTIPVEVVATFEGREYRTWTSFIHR